MAIPIGVVKAYAAAIRYGRKSFGLNAKVAIRLPKARPSKVSKISLYFEKGCTMKDDSDKEGYKVASGGDSEGQSDEDGMEYNTSLKNSDAEFLRRGRVGVYLTFYWRGNYMVMTEMFRASLSMIARL